MQNVWQPLAEADLDAVMALAACAHPTFPERREVFAEKRALFPSGALRLTAAADAQGGISGYAFAHPWVESRLPKLDHFLGALPAAPNCLYLHDCVVAPHARGRNASGDLIDHLRSLARAASLPQLTLIAVYGSEAAWMRHGFRPVDWPEANETLAGYGHGARLLAAMV